MDIKNVSASYFNGINELFGKKSTNSQRALGFIKTVSYVTVIFPLVFGLMYGAAVGIEKLRGRVKPSSPDEGGNKKVDSVSKEVIPGAKNPQNAGGMWSDPSKVIEEYGKLLLQDIAIASEYILRVDENGDTVFHELVRGQNIQHATLALIKDDPDLYIECCVEIKNNQGKSALDIAIERGQMGMVKDFFPRSGESEFMITDPDEVNHLKETLTSLINVLARPLEAAELYKSCPGESEYDKLSHIHSAILALICFGYEDAFIEAVSKLSDEDKANLPFELTLFARLSKEEMREAYERLRAECTGLESKKAISDKMDEWKFEPPELTPSDYLSFSQFKRKHGTETLKTLILLAYTGDTVNIRNTHMNALRDLFNPFRAYDQWLDFNDKKYTFSENGEPILHSLVKDENITLDDLRDIIPMFVIKNPDFFQARDSNGKNLLEYLEMGEEGSKEHELKKLLEKAMSGVPLLLFEFRVMKSLKYYLEDKGQEIASKEKKMV